jgi:hypothetical protein
MFIQVSDFNEGKYEVHTGAFDVARLQDYIDKYEKRYLVELLGADLYAQFEADVIAGGGSPTEQRFNDILEPFEVDYLHSILISEGMVEMLIGFIYFEYTKDQIVAMSPVGNVRPKGQNSEIASSLYTQIYNRYNEAVRTYKAIQIYIHQNSGDYSDYNGVQKYLANYL